MRSLPTRVRRKGPAGNPQVAQNVTPLVEAVLQDDVSAALLGDNAAALVAFQQGSGSWRSRDLGMSASHSLQRRAFIRHSQTVS